MGTVKDGVVKRMYPQYGVYEVERRMLWSECVVASLHHAPRASLAIEIADSVVEEWEKRFRER